MLITRRPSAFLPYLLVSIAGLMAACGSPDGPGGNDGDGGTDARHPTLVTPSAQSIQSAQPIQEQIPGAAVYFSQHSGAIARVDSARLSGLNDSAAPLVEARGTDEASEHSALMEFMLRFGGSYGLQNPLAELRVARDAVNDPLKLSPEQMSDADLPALAGLRMRHLVQTVGGVPVPGREVIGFFDARGGLQSVVARLLKTDASFSVAPSLSGAQVWSRFAIGTPSLRDGAVARNPSLNWMSALTASDAMLEHSEELAIEMIDAEGDLDSASPSARPRLVYHLAVRWGLAQTMLVVDAGTGELIESIDTTPGESWSENGNLEIAGANDETGTRFSIFSAIDYKGRRYIGNAPRNGSPNYIAPRNFISVSDASTLTNRAGISYIPVSISSTIGGNANTWSTDPTYVGTKRQAGPLFANILAAHEYWSNLRHWDGWDGKGTVFWGSINNHWSANPAPEIGAKGGNGSMQMGDGTSPTGQFLGSSPEVVAHEFTHSVVGATAGLAYLNESGAANEALADFFGVAKTANRAADDYATDSIGDDVGFGIRNLNDPTLKAQPDRYSDFKVLALSDDAGGVHTNSGILNKAHTLLVKGGTFNGVTVKRVGLARTEQILWAALRLRAYGEFATMEEFAQGVMTTCRLTHDVNRLLGDNSYAATCSSFRSAYIAVELIPRFGNVTVAATIADRGVFKALVDSTQKATAVKTGVRITDLVSARAYPTITPTNADLEAGTQSTLTASLPAELLSPSNAKRRLNAELVTDGITETDAAQILRHSSFVIGSDLVPDHFEYRFSPLLSGYGIKAFVANPEATGFTAGTQAAVLARFGGHASFDVLAGNSIVSGRDSLAADVAGAGPVAVLDQASNGTSQYNFGNGLSIIPLASATEIVGQPGRFEVWYDTQGGLAELDNRFQVYVLADSGDQVDELNETNNLMCANCQAPGQVASGQMGVIVRFPKGAPVASLFPAPLRAAAAKLPAAYDRMIPVAPLPAVRLPYVLPGTRSFTGI